MTLQKKGGFKIKDGCYLVPMQPIDTAFDANFLAHKILGDKYDLYRANKPLLLPVMRGGCEIFLPLSGLFRYYLRRDNEKEDVDYVSIKVSRYERGAINQDGQVHIDDSDITKVLAELHYHDEAILIDDVFDRGKTLKEIKKRLDVAGKKIIIATAHFKPEHNETDIVPDYTIRYFYNQLIGDRLYSPWIVYHWESDDHDAKDWNEMFPQLQKQAEPSFLKPK